MKNNIYKLITLAVLAFSLVSCDSFLDIKPLGKVIPTTLEDYRELFTTVYNNQINDRSKCDMRTDEIQVNGNEFDQNNYSYIEKWDVENFGEQFEWAYYYSNMYTCNIIIKNKDKMKNGTPEEVNQLVGEAYMMRAYSHFNLVNIYGEPYTKVGAVNTLAVPLKLDVDLEAVLSPNTVGEIYEQILADLDKAGELLNVDSWEVGLNYRFTTLSVLALRSRVALYMGNWDDALKYSEALLALKSDLVDYRVNLPDDSKTFIMPNHFKSVENITAYEMTYSQNTTKASKATLKLYNIFDDGDLRKSLYFGNKFKKDGKKYEDGEEIDENNLLYSINKIDGTTAYRCSFRVAEFYLNAAEAACRLNNLSKATSRLLALDATRYAPKAFNAKKAAIEAMNSTQLLEEILIERNRELAFEGHRWFDLRRTTRPELKKELDGKTYILKQDDHRYTIEIPKAAVESNPSLSQSGSTKETVSH